MWTFYASAAITIAAMLACWALVRINRADNEEAKRKQEEQDAQDLRFEIAKRRCQMYSIRGGKK